MPPFIYLFATLDFIRTIAVFFQTQGAKDPKMLAGLISTHIVAQLLSLISLLPSLILCSIAVFKIRMTNTWFTTLLRIYAWLLILCLPVLTLVGAYVYWLARPRNV